MAIQIKTTHTLTCRTSDLTVGVLSNFLHPLKEDSVIRVSIMNGDRPGELNMVTITADVDEQHHQR